MKKKAIITGIFGQDGVYLSKFLIKKNYEIIGIYNKVNSNQFLLSNEILKKK